MKRKIPPDQQCFFCANRWTVAIGGQRICAHHAQLVDEIAKDAGVPVHITVHRLSSNEPRPPNPEKIGSIMPRVVAEILANARPVHESPAVPTLSSRER